MKAVEKKMSSVIKDFIGCLEKDPDNDLYYTESDMKCLLYLLIRKEFSRELKSRKYCLLTEYLITKLPGMSNAYGAYEHPRIDVVLLNSGRDRIVYGIELKNGYSSPKKGEDVFTKDVKRIKDLNRRGKVDYGTCLWYDICHNNCKEIEKKVNGMGTKRIKCIYIHTPGKEGE
ncbi:MAG: hypothetical protein PHG85_01960 [Candidatus Altiarchaeota archaeon]|nr:hypothetical protein [Candidatus Altiarchaeota archaeon]